MAMTPQIAALRHRHGALAATALPLFSATILLSAFLLFSVQPFFAKMVLPRLGGTPAVWSVAMVFFQAMLLAGYAYAHILTRRLPLTAAVIVHLAVMAIAFIALPIAIPAGWEQPPETSLATGTAFWLLALFTVSVGLPFFAVSANAPLLQAWFARTGHAHAHDPYFLYGASNIGSFASLILYIVAFEPTMTLSRQSMVWTAGFVVLVLSIAACGAIAFMLSEATQANTVEEAVEVKPAGWRERGEWMLLAAIPSALLVAVTAHLSIDIAAAPFLWVIPLALFLLTFVIAFARKPLIGARPLSLAVPILAALVFASFVLGGKAPVWATLALHLVFFFAAALLIHTVLVARRPAAADLTGFYLWMSLGGVLGGAFTALMSPVLFNSSGEYPLLVLAALLVWPFFGDKSGSDETNRQLRLFVLVAALIALIVNNPHIASAIAPHDAGFYTVAIATFALASALALLRSRALHLFFATLVVGLYFAMQAASGNLFMQRSFFGVVKAFETDNGRFVVMAHGTTEHGAMRTADRNRKPTPISYYHDSGAIAATLSAAQQRIAARNDGKPANMGVVGLGTGTILCRRGPGEIWTTFEIDQAVVNVASDPRVFGFLPHCGNGDPIILGDARLRLADQPDGKFDYLLIDAFSSDSIPVHLLTVEAIELYRAKLAPGGMLAVHISNRYMELSSVMAALAAETGMAGRTADFAVPDALRRGEHINPTSVAVLARTEADLGSLASDPRWRPLAANGTAPWTDDYSDILSAILRRQFD